MALNDTMAGNADPAQKKLLFGIYLKRNFIHMQLKANTA
jgi:hypothetical protein